MDHETKYPILNGFGKMKQQPNAENTSHHTFLERLYPTRFGNTCRAINVIDLVWPLLCEHLPHANVFFTIPSNLSTGVSPLVAPSLLHALLNDLLGSGADLTCYSEVLPQPMMLQGTR